MGVIADAGRTAPAHPGRESQPLKAACRRNGKPECQPRSEAAVGSHAGVRIAAVMLLSLTLLACAAASAPHIGKTARLENRLSLSGLPKGEATWKAKDLDIHYRAVQSGDNLEISGFINFNSNLAKFPLVSYFKVYLHFMDAQGVVLNSHLLWATGINQEVRFVRWTFERQLPTTPGAVSMGFSYRGGASEAGGKNKIGSTKTGWEVYRSP